MQHQSSSYSYPPYAASASQKHYPTAHSTSSAFSASANPNEDWTKISDLAERRRIQNRIAQRNYRKKLKKRLEDLERRAGSSSASPEQRHQELPDSESIQSSSHASSQRQRSSSSQSRREQTPEVLAQQYVLPSSSEGMFQQQFTRQMSTSPPPFSYASMPPVDGVSYSNYPVAASYCTMQGNGAEVPVYSQYGAHGLPHAYAVSNISSPPIKQEYYGDDEINPFSMSYASINEMPVPPYTPPLSDSSEHWQAVSPPADGPRTPSSLRGTPPLSLYDHS